MRIGATELILIFIVALIVIGPDKLPYYAKQLGETLAQFKKATETATKDIKESVIDPLDEVQKPIREAIEPVEELNKAVNGNLKDLTKSINDIGKKKSSTPSAPVRTETGDSDVEADVPTHETAQDNANITAIENAAPSEADMIPENS